jgi:exodeoxyribonuclease V alpha subunit
MSANPNPQDRPAQTLERLSGLVERVTFQNADSGFCVLRLKVKGERDVVTLVGHTPTVTPGEYASASGTWVTDREHGRQFKAVFVKISPPNTLTGIERYLGSGMVKGIGPVYAGRLVKAFGAGVFDTIERHPARLREIEGIGEVRARRIVSGWADQKVIREIMVFLHGHGVSTSRAVRIFKTYGADAIQVVSANPYQLARDIRGIGFLSADIIAQKIGIARDSPLRARAGVSYALA